MKKVYFVNKFKHVVRMIVITGRAHTVETKMGMKRCRRGTEVALGGVFSGSLFPNPKSRDLDEFLGLVNWVVDD